MQKGVEHKRNDGSPDQIKSGPSNPCVEMQHFLNSMETITFK